MKSQFPITPAYPKSYVGRIMAADALIFLIGLGILGTPFALGKLPGDFDTTVHVALGALVCVLSVFRVLVAYGDNWPEVPLAFLGVLIFLLPTFMHMHWNAGYAMPHMAAGVAIIVLAAISFLMTAVEMKHPRYKGN